DVRGNIEKWFRELDWASYTRQLVAKTNQILDGMIDVLGTRSARWMMDKQGLNRLIAQLRSLKAKAQQKIEQAMGSLQQSHQMAMAQPLPNTTAGSRASRHADTPRQSPPGSSAPASSGGNAGKPAQQSTNTASQTPAASSTPAARRDTATGNQTAASAPASKPQQQPATSSSASSGRSSQTTTDKQPASAKRDVAIEPKGNTTPAQGQVSPQLRQSQRSRYSRHNPGFKESTLPTMTLSNESRGKRSIMEAFSMKVANQAIRALIMFGSSINCRSATGSATPKAPTSHSTRNWKVPRKCGKPWNTA
ncbi:hypothetical protein ACF8GB_16745, partial [Pseudomonas sp. xss_4]